MAAISISQSPMVARMNRFVSGIATSVTSLLPTPRAVFRETTHAIANLKNRMVPVRQDTSSTPAERSKEGEAEVAHAGDENPVRGNWSNHADFILSCIGYAVGLGNVWRFPYLCYKNGGGAFVVIYWILSACVGFPIIVLEQSLGQFTSQGPMHCWQYAPIVTGIGYAMVAVSFLTIIYYCTIIAWSAFYMFASFRSQLQWETCDFETWADYRCEMSKLGCYISGGGVRGFDGLCYNASYVAKSLYGCPSLNETDIPARNVSTVLGYWNESLTMLYGVQSRLSSDEYFHNYVLSDDEQFGWNNFGLPKWELVLCQLLVWLLVFVCLINGVKSAGKVVWFTALTPYVILFVLIGRGLTLPGAYDGIMFFLTPNFDKLRDPGVWYDATGQLFFSLSACWGGMIALPSYNRFNNNFVRDSLIVVFADTFTSFIASFAIFSILGHGAYLLDRPVDQVVEVGTGLAFIMYPKVLVQLPGSVAWSICFFFMCILLGLDTEFNISETVFTAFLDLYPKARQPLRRKATFFAIFCICCFGLSIPFVCPGGRMLLSIFDDYIATWAIFVIAIVESLSLAYLYGFWRYIDDIKLCLKWLPSTASQVWMAVFWGLVTPGMLTFIMIYSWITYQARELDIEEGIGWMLTMFVFLWIPGVACYMLVTRGFDAFKPTKEWGPFVEKFKTEFIVMKAKKAAEKKTKRAQSWHFSQFLALPPKLVPVNLTSLTKDKLPPKIRAIVDMDDVVDVSTQPIPDLKKLPPLGSESIYDGDSAADDYGTFGSNSELSRSPSVVIINENGISVV